jgi:hypothetical protein
MNWKCKMELDDIGDDDNVTNIHAGSCSGLPQKADVYDIASTDTMLVACKYSAVGVR